MHWVSDCISRNCSTLCCDMRTRSVAQRLCRRTVSICTSRTRSVANCCLKSEHVISDALNQLRYGDNINLKWNGFTANLLIDIDSIHQDWCRGPVHSHVMTERVRFWFILFFRFSSTALKTVWVYIECALLFVIRSNFFRPPESIHQRPRPSAEMKWHDCQFIDRHLQYPQNFEVRNV